MKKISIKLDSAEIGKAIKEIQEYREELNKKIELFVDALIHEGMNVAKARLASTRGDSTDASVDSFYISSTGDIIKAVIYLEGEDALFVEFGAGIVFNPVDHPLAASLGYGPGTYPGQTHVPMPGYWYYGDGKLSVGTEATMPIYGAAEHMRNVIVQKANEVFRS